MNLVGLFAPQPFVIQPLPFPTAEHTETKKEKIANYIILAANIVITFVAMRYINRKVDQLKPAFVYERRKERYVVAVCSLVWRRC